MTAILPHYLHRPDTSGQTFGTLRLVTLDGNRLWEMRADPQVCVMAKRLFPGSSGRGQGIARFPAGRRAFADLVWFLHRWPLRIEDEAAWEEAYRDACRHVADRVAVNEGQVPALPAPRFTGSLGPFQQAGLAFLLGNRRTLLADEMGLGKTVQALAFLANADAWPALIVAPPHLLHHWIEKARQFLGAVSDGNPLFDPVPAGGLSVHLLRGRKPYALPRAHLYLVHYGLLVDWWDRLKTLRPPTIIMDEIQDLRHRDTKKYSAASDLAARADNLVGLSGTPIYNRGGEIWNILNIVEYHCLGDWESFTREWCTGYGSDAVENPEALGAFLRREGLMLRRRKEDVLDDLPPKRRCIEHIDGDSTLFAKLVAGAIRRARAAADLADPLARGREEREAVAETRRATGLAKAGDVAAFVAGLLEAEVPTLVFAHHHAVMDELAAGLRVYEPVMISGRQTAAEKTEARDRFAEGKTSVCLISLRSATGIDGLQHRARAVVFAELDWSPAVHAQAEDRAHRMGQKDSVLVYYLVTATGTDPEMMESLGFKTSQFIGLMGDRPEDEQDRALASADTSKFMQQVLSKLRGGG